MGSGEFSDDIQQKLKVTKIEFQIQSRREGHKQPIESRIIIKMTGEPKVGDVICATLSVSDHGAPSPATYNPSSREITFQLHHTLWPACQNLVEQVANRELYVHYSDSSNGITHATLSGHESI